MDTQTKPSKVGVVFKDYPRLLTWNNKNYKITKLGLHHKYFEGKVLFHIFSVTSDSLFFRLKLNTQNLIWTLEDFKEYEF